MRKIFSFLICLFLSVSVFAHDNIMSGEKNLKVLTTKWFDIVYPEGSERSALILYENVDRIYEEVGEMYGFPPRERMPLVLTSVVQQQNAFWSPSPYNHIAIYDTYPVSALDVFSENLLSTFRHEVTHAYTYNLKNNFWHAMSFFGDVLNPGYLLMTVGWAEGATVSSESAAGEGRLNNGFTLQMIRQAKIENQFPVYRDVQGASDKYPANTFYYFNGAFNAWLQKTYGMEKYASFWYKCVNFQTILPTVTFKKIYGMKIKTAWNMFKASVEVPSVPANPIGQYGVQDFFTPESEKYSIHNNAGAIYESFSASEKGLFYLDLKCSTVYFADKADLQKDKIKQKILFAKDNVQAVKSSRDGKYLAVESYSYAENNVKTIASVYDVQKKRFIIEEKGLFSSSIIKKDDEYFLIGTKYKAQEYSIFIKKICDSGEEQKNVEPSIYSLPVFVEAGNYDDTSFAFGEGTFAFIKKNGLTQTVCINDINGNLIREYELPDEDMYIKSISVDYSGNGLLFSWVDKNCLPRLGKLSLKEGTFTLQQKDLSGGVYYPVEVEEGTVIYEGEFFRQNRIFTAKINNLLDSGESQTVNANVEEKLTGINQTEVNQTAVTQPEENQTEDNQTEDFEKSDYAGLSPEQIVEKINLKNPKKYNPLDFYTQGIFLPVSLYSSVSHSDKETSTVRLPYGVTWISGNPWSSGLLIATAGYGIMTNSWGLEASYQSATGSGSGTFTADLATEFDTKGWKQSKADVSAKRIVPFGYISQFSVSDTASVFIGRNNEAMDIEGFLNSVEENPANVYSVFIPGFIKTSAENYFYAANTLALRYSNIRRVGSGKYEKGGISLQTDFVYGYLAEITRNTYADMIGNLAFAITGYIPKLLPVKCVDRFTYNLPARINLGFLPYTSTVNTSFTRPANSPSLFSADVEMILFGFDLQKAIPFLPILFVNNLQISAVYYGAYLLPNKYMAQKWNFTKLPEIFGELTGKAQVYSQWTALRITAGLTPNLGVSANRSFKLDYYFEGGINTTITETGTKINPSFTFGYTSTF